MTDLHLSICLWRPRDKQSCQNYVSDAAFAALHLGVTPRRLFASLCSLTGPTGGTRFVLPAIGEYCSLPRNPGKKMNSVTVRLQPALACALRITTNSRRIPPSQLTCYGASSTDIQPLVKNNNRHYCSRMEQGKGLLFRQVSDPGVSVNSFHAVCPPVRWFFLNACLWFLLNACHCSLLC